MATLTAELPNCLNTYVKGVYPTDPSLYWDALTLKPAIPITGQQDRLLQYITEVILLIRNPQIFAYGNTLSAADLKDLYKEIDTMLAEGIANLTLVQAAVHTHYLALP